MTMENTRDDRVATSIPLAVRPLFGRLQHQQRGQLKVVLDSGRHYRFTGTQPGPVASLHLHRPVRLSLRRWHTRVQAKSAEILTPGFDERCLAIWRYYLAYCEAGFRAGRIDLMQVALQPAD